MTEQVLIQVAEGADALTGALPRYDMLERLDRVARANGVTVLAWGFGAAELRLVVDGAEPAVTQVVKALKIGTRHKVASYGLDLAWARLMREPVAAAGLPDAIAWAHVAPIEHLSADPLSSPWSSHRDLLGYRVAEFFDPGPARDRVDPLAIHALAGGVGIPDGWPPANPQSEPLQVLLRVAAGILGVLPADRRCFHLFAHLARARGWKSEVVAKSLALTERRIRQLQQQPAIHLDMALLTLGDANLCRVP